MNIFKKRNISFIIPAYNCAKFLPDTINSIFNGNFTTGDEVIIIDDASTDKTLKIAEKLQKKYPAIRIFQHQYNKGSAAAGRNTGIDNSNNDLIFCLDADNVLYPKSISRLKEFMINRGADAASFGELHFFEKNIRNVTHKWFFYSNITLYACINERNKTPATSGNYLFTKKSWTKAGRYFEPTLLNQTLDSWTFAIRQLASGAKMITLKGTFYFHRCGYNSHFVREYNKGNVSIAAMVGLTPFLDVINDKDVEYIFSKEHRRTWFNELNTRPIRIINKLKAITDSDI